MLIQVHYPDNHFDYVKEKLLQKLIETRKILRFRRTSGWVTIGVDPLRQFQRNFNHKPADEIRNIVRVEYNDNSYDYVTDKTLDALIESNRIIKFKRITGWVMIGSDHLRKSNREYTHRYPSELKKH